MRTNQTGFTIIELIVVIALLGILSAVALPRFINVTEDAHNAAVEGAGAGFATGVALLKAQVVANGELGGANVDDVEGYGDDPTLDVNTRGYPVSTTGDNNLLPGGGADCSNVWNAIFQAGGATASTAAPTGSNIDYIASLSSGNCEYDYQGDSVTTRVITYTASTGAVSVALP